VGKFGSTVLGWAAWWTGIALVVMFGSALIGLPLGWWQSVAFGVMFTVFYKWIRFWRSGSPYP
jgi:hypothetical protein